MTTTAPDPTPAPPATVPPSRLVLWDVDHTLIESRGIGRELYAEAFQQATGQPMVAMAEFAGRTEPMIMGDMLGLHSIEPTPELLAALTDALAAVYHQGKDRLARTGRALPGARTVLAALAQRPDVVNTVLTGNLHQVAVTKLTAFDLIDYLDLDVGAYGSDHAHRPTLVGIARERASAKYATNFPPETITLIGDTPHDVAAGLHAGAHVLGVATGKTTAADLTAAGAHVVLPDLTSLPDVIRAVNLDSRA